MRVDSVCASCQQRVWDQVIAAPTSAPVLSHPQYDVDFHLDTDASAYGLGACLAQNQGNKERILGYFSRRLKAAEMHYSTPQKDALGVMEGLEHLRPLVFGYKCVIFTDQRSLIWLFQRGSPGRYMRYRERL